MKLSTFCGGSRIHSKELNEGNAEALPPPRSVLGRRFHAVRRRAIRIVAGGCES